jgi:hypothetical protein
MEKTTAAESTTYDIDELKAANPGRDLSLFENDEYEIEWVVKTPLPGDYQAFRAQQNAAGDDLVPVIKAFVMNHVVWPSRAEVKETLGRHAALIEPAVKAVLKLAGARAEFSVKKL